MIGGFEGAPARAGPGRARRAPGPDILQAAARAHEGIAHGFAVASHRFIRAARALWHSVAPPAPRGAPCRTPSTGGP